MNARVNVCAQCPVIDWCLFLGVFPSHPGVPGIDFRLIHSNPYQDKALTWDEWMNNPRTYFNLAGKAKRKPINSSLGSSYGMNSA